MVSCLSTAESGQNCFWDHCHGWNSRKNDFLEFICEKENENSKTRNRVCRHPRHGQIRIYADSMCSTCKQFRFDCFISYVSLILFTFLLQRICSTCHNYSLHCNLCMKDDESLENFQIHYYKTIQLLQLAVVLYQQAW